VKTTILTEKLNLVSKNIIERYHYVIPVPEEFGLTVGGLVIKQEEYNK